jgi:hypothetical protein
VAYVVLGAAILVVVLLVIPAWVAWKEESEPEVRPTVRENAREARRAVSVALQSLSRDPGQDPRGVIVRLYGRLLQGILRRFGAVDPLTAREIERYCVSELGVRSGTARELTDLFEAARYSSRPMGAAEVARTRAALTAALKDLSVA